MSNPFDAADSCVEPFDTLDPYNDNQISGLICKQGDHRYGALYIDAVNGIPVKGQLIYCTPKLHYPFDSAEDGTRVFHWPPFQAIRVYPKLDGTNICAYSYADNNGVRYVTFKTRLTPVLRLSKFGDFKSLWDEMLVRYPYLVAPDIIRDGSFTASFELYGYRNPVLIKYQEALETKLLFLVSQKDHAVWINSHYAPFTPVANPCLYTLQSTEDVSAFYDRLRAENKSGNVVNDDGTISGSEGFVFYAFTAATNLMFKCKSEDIESLHWSTGGIDRNSIYTTCVNALENHDITELTADIIISLLLEEFTPDQIGKSQDRIEKALIELRQRMKFKAIIETHLKGCPVRDQGKAPVMRYMSQFFRRDEMKAVYSMMHELGFV
jgi:hypothetical protein